jgi:hypothetical protein
MVDIRVAFFAVPVVIGFGVAVTACGGSPGTVKPAASATQSASASAPSSSPATSPSGPASATASASAAGTGSAAAVPSGYTRIGGSAQGISIAVPASWVVINPATQSFASAAKRAGLKDVSASELEQDMTSLQKLHGIIVFDVKSGVDSPTHFSRNLNTYCSVSGVTEAGAAAVPFIKQAASAEFQQLGSTNITQQDLAIGGVPGVETSYQVQSSTEGTLRGSQLEVAPKPDQLCFVTLSYGAGESGGTVLSTAAATAQFP